MKNKLVESLAKKSSSLNEKIVKVEKYKCMEYDENDNLIKIDFLFRLKV